MLLRTFPQLSRLAMMAICLATIPWVLPVKALDVPPRPTASPVVDQTNTLSKQEVTTLEQKIEAERAATSNQIGVLLIPSLEDESLEEYALQVAREWGIGSREQDNGVLLLVVKEDRKIRIEVGYGLEGALTDVQSSRIIRERIAPAFREEKYAEGVNSGVDGIITAIHGEFKAGGGTSPSTASTNGFPWEAMLLFGFIGFSWLGSILARTKSWWAGGVIGGIAGVLIALSFGWLFIGISSIILLTLIGLLFDRAVSQNYHKRADHGDTPSWWAGGGFLGGGGSGGGFGGFGGGGFGGGGSSGSW